jgi:tetratricopeptide (TPR) repeat protein
MTIGKRLSLGIILLLAGALGAAADPSFDTELLSIQQAWAVANYSTAKDAQDAAFEQLGERVSALALAHPTRAEALVWQGIIESSHAGARGGLGALGLAKKARASLEAALELDPDVLDGSAYTSLGALYYKVPGFPLGFGDHEKAAKLLRTALDRNPDGIDPNYFYADYLFEQHQYADALPYLERASHAPARPGRELADRGRQAEIAALTAKVRAKLG